MRTCEHGCNGCDECTDYGDMTPDEQNREYLRQHPAQELSLWMDWVQTVCRWKKVAPPTGREWDALTTKWAHGKAPVDSVDELVALRETPNVGNQAGRWASPGLNS